MNSPGAFAQTVWDRALTAKPSAHSASCRKRACFPKGERNRVCWNLTGTVTSVSVNPHPNLLPPSTLVKSPSHLCGAQLITVLWCGKPNDAANVKALSWGRGWGEGGLQSNISPLFKNCSDAPTSPPIPNHQFHRRPQSKIKTQNSKIQSIPPSFDACQISIILRSRKPGAF